SFTTRSPLFPYTTLVRSEGATVPFIARYRKEVTGSLDEVFIAAIRDRVEQLRELDKRRESILKSLKDQEKLTPELEEKVLAAERSEEHTSELQSRENLVC